MNFLTKVEGEDSRKDVECGREGTFLADERRMKGWVKEVLACSAELIVQEI